MKKKKKKILIQKEKEKEKRKFQQKVKNYYFFNLILITMIGRKKLKLQEDALNFLHEIPNELKVLTGLFSFIKIY